MNKPIRWRLFAALLSPLALAGISLGGLVPTAAADIEDANSTPASDTASLGITLSGTLVNDDDPYREENLAMPGWTYLWDITVTNDSEGGEPPMDAENVTITHVVPPGFRNVNDFPGDLFECVVGTPDPVLGTKVTCDADSVPAGYSETINVVSIVEDDATGTFTSVVSATTTTPQDPDAADDLGDVVEGSFIDWYSDLAVTAEALGPAIVGEDLPIRVTITNYGPDTTKYHELIAGSFGFYSGDFVPDFDNMPPKLDRCNPSEIDPYLCFGEGLAPGESVSFDGVFKVASEAEEHGYVLIRFNVAPVANDSDPSDNEFQLQVPLNDDGDEAGPDPEEPVDPDPDPDPEEPVDPDPDPDPEEPVDPDPSSDPTDVPTTPAPHPSDPGQPELPVTGSASVAQGVLALAAMFLGAVLLRKRRVLTS